MDDTRCMTKKVILIDASGPMASCRNRGRKDCKSEPRFDQGRNVRLLTKAAKETVGVVRKSRQSPGSRVTVRA